MLFNSLPFLFVFWPLCFIGFYASGRHSARAAMVFLTFASLAFYGYWNILYLPLLVSLIIANSLMGQIILRYRSRVWLTLGVGLNLACLGYFKYADFFVGNLNALGAGLPFLHIVLPLGISFFTFQKISYLVDCYRGLVKDRGFWNYALFVSLFPQLIAGPIVRFTEISPQFADKNFGRLDWTKIATGLFLFIIGLSKKVLFADHLAQIATPIFTRADSGLGIYPFEAWTGLLAYTFQIYFDFSGYSDMAIGLGMMLGLVIPQNFQSPYKSASIIEFWRTWHMTLSRFLRDYLYVPLGGNRAGAFRRFLNLVIVMLLGGLWHGASWNFVIWGGLHGSYLIINHGWRRLVPEGKTQRLSPRLLKTALTFLAVMAAWAFFRAATPGGAVALLSSLFSAHGLPPLPIAALLENTDLLLLSFCALIIWLFPNSLQQAEDFSKSLKGNQVKAFPAGVMYGMALVVCLFFIYTGSYSEFIYFQF
jgi:alginate O-acetyltransferase complex protein AlgI